MRVDDENCFVANTCCASLLGLSTENDPQIGSGIIGKAACTDMPLKSTLSSRSEDIQILLTLTASSFVWHEEDHSIHACFS